jgi:hypothetical protein
MRAALDAEIAGAALSLKQPPEKTWRCFHCDEVFTTAREAASHFGGEEGALTACQIKAFEFHLVHRIRDLEDQLARYRAEDSDVMRSIMTLEADHRQALIRAEEQGYARGLRDGEVSEF